MTRPLVKAPVTGKSAAFIVFKRHLLLGVKQFPECGALGGHIGVHLTEELFAFGTQFEAALPVIFLTAVFGAEVAHRGISLFLGSRVVFKSLLLIVPERENRLKCGIAVCQRLLHIGTRPVTARAVTGAVSAPGISARGGGGKSGSDNPAFHHF